MGTKRPMHAALYVDGKKGTLCGLREGVTPIFDITSATDFATCRQCRDIIDGVPPEAEPQVDWPGAVEGIDPMTRRIIALGHAAPALTSKGKGAPLASGGTEPPHILDLITLTEYLVSGGPAAAEFYAEVCK